MTNVMWRTDGEMEYSKKRIFQGFLPHLDIIIFCCSDHVQAFISISKYESRPMSMYVWCVTGYVYCGSMYRHEAALRQWNT
jgi:hypothetical protein